MYTMKYNDSTQLTILAAIPFNCYGSVFSAFGLQELSLEGSEVFLEARIVEMPVMLL
jgi:hypothetical protein